MTSTSTPLIKSLGSLFLALHHPYPWLGLAGDIHHHVGNRGGTLDAGVEHNGQTSVARRQLKIVLVLPVKSIKNIVIFCRFLSFSVVFCPFFCHFLSLSDILSVIFKSL